MPRAAKNGIRVVRSDKWLAHGFSLGWFGMAWRARCRGPLMDSTRSVAVRVVVAVLMGHSGTLPPVAAAVLVARTHHAHAFAQHVVLAVALAAGLHAKAQAFARRRGGWRRAGLRQRGRCGAARAVMPPRRLVGGGRRLGLRIGARAWGLALALRRPSWVPGRAAGAAWAGAAALPTTGRRRQAQQSGVPPGRRLYRGGGGATGARWHHCGAGIGRCRRG